MQACLIKSSLYFFSQWNTKYSPNLSKSNPKVDSVDNDVYPKIDYEATSSDEERMNVGRK